MDIVLLPLNDAILGLPKYNRLETITCLYLEDIQIVIFNYKKSEK